MQRSHSGLLENSSMMRNFFLGLPHAEQVFARIDDILSDVERERDS
jgi:hypothetical protein